LYRSSNPLGFILLGACAKGVTVSLDSISGTGEGNDKASGASGIVESGINFYKQH